MNADVLLEHFHRLGDAPDAVPRLRRFILDLAVRGKLVEQNVQEGEALALLPKLHSGKARLLQQGAIRKPRELEPGQDQEPPFNIPATWHWCRLDEVGAIVGGGTPTSTNADFYTDGGKGIGWLTPADLGRNKAAYVSHGAKDLTESGLAASSASLLPAGSVVFSSRAPIGYTAIASRALTTNQGFKSVVPYITECNSYIAIYFKAFTPEIEDKASGTTFKEVSAKQVAGLLFPLPPLPEQHRIVAKVNELMELCDRLEAAQQEREQRRTRLTAASWQALTSESDPNAAPFALEQLPALTTRPQQIAALRQTILDLAVRGRLVNQDATDEPAEVLLKRIAKEKERLVRSGELRNREAIPEVDLEEVSYQLPSGWAWGRVGQLGLTQTGTTPSKNHGDHFGDHIPFVKPADLLPNEVVYDNEGLSSDGLAESGRVAPAGSILMVCIGTIGKCQVIRQPCSFNQQINSLTPYCGLDPDFLLTAFRASDFHASAWAASSKSTLSLLNKGRWELLYLPLPPLAEQRRIVAKVDELMRLCDTLEATLVQGEITKGKLLEAVLHSEAAPRTRPTAPVQQVVPRPAKQRATYTEPETELALAAEPMAPAFQTPLRRLRGRPAKNGPLTTSATHLIREHLHNHPGLHGKSAIVEATGVDAAAWNAAIKELLAEGSVVREGEKKGARYRAKK